jgi:LruC domain-containing protein
MKRSLLLLLMVSLLFSCRKEWETDPIQSQTGDMESLKIPASFDWNMNRQITIDGSFLVGGGIVHITSTDGKTEFYKGVADGKPVTLVVPKIYEDVLVNGQSHNQMSMMKEMPFLKGTLASTYSFVNNFTNIMTLQYDAVRLTDNTFAIYYITHSPFQPKVVIANQSGNAISYGLHNQIAATAGSYYTSPRLVKIGENKLLAAFIDNNNGYRIRIIVLTVSGNNVIVGFSSYLSNHQVSNFEMDCLEDGTVAFAYVRRDQNPFYIITRVVENLTSASPSYGSELTISDAYNSNFDYRIDLAAVSSNKYIVGSYMSPSYSNYLTRASVIVKTGSQIQAGPLTNINVNAMPQRSSDIIKVAEDKTLFFYTGMAGWLFYRFGQISGNTIVWGPEYQFESGSNYYNLKASLINQNTIQLCYSDPRYSYYAHFRTARINGNQLELDPAYNSGVRVNFMYYYEYMPIPSFHLGNNKLIVLLSNYYGGSGYGMTYLGSYQPPIADADGDGIPDDQDDYPNDPLKAFDNYYPAAGFGSLAYEDLWPGKGDYDFNDLVVDYRFHTVTNAQNKVVNIKATFASKASGAYLNNGFGFNLPDASGALVSGPINYHFIASGSKLNENYINYNSSYGTEHGQSKPTFIVHDNFFKLMPNPGTGIGVNTIQEAPFVAFDTTMITIVPTAPAFTMNDFSVNTWNPFIIVDLDRGHEVHLADYPVTDLADPGYFGMWEDNSNPATGRTYKTIQNLPWAIDVPSAFAWPKEKIDITQAYRKFAAWAESGGQLYPDWYTNEQGYRNDDLIYELTE